MIERPVGTGRVGGKGRGRALEPTTIRRTTLAQRRAAVVLGREVVGNLAVGRERGVGRVRGRRTAVARGRAMVGTLDIERVGGRGQGRGQKKGAKPRAGDDKTGEIGTEKGNGGNLGERGKGGNCTA